MSDSNRRPKKSDSSSQKRKSGINSKKEGSVRNTNGKVTVDFQYLGHRVREPSGLKYTKENALLVRDQLDRIILAIKDGSFEYRKVFPGSKKVEFFSRLERRVLKRTKQPDELLIKEYIWEWYEILKASDRVSERTLHGYKRHIELYLYPFLGIYHSEISTQPLWMNTLCGPKISVTGVNPQVIKPSIRL